MLDPAFDVLETLKPTMGIFYLDGEPRDLQGPFKGQRKSIVDGRPILTMKVLSLTTEHPFGLAALMTQPDFSADAMCSSMNRTKPVENRPEDIAATILLSHRPDAFKAAARHDVSLMLSGHTHGGQAASLWTLHFRALSTAQISTGPLCRWNHPSLHLGGIRTLDAFSRLNCPCESPLITLTRPA